jgi:hypothetical protein
VRSIAARTVCSDIGGALYRVRSASIFAAQSPFSPTGPAQPASRARYVLRRRSGFGLPVTNRR